jgi:predicted nucleic acid-binding protein
LDANVFVYAATDSPYTKEAEALVRAGGVTDALAVAETFGALKRITKDHDAAFRVVRRILGQFDVIPVDSEIIFRAMKRNDLHIADAIHLVASEGYTFVSFDKDFAKRR